MRFAALATFALAATSLAGPAARWDSSAVDGAGLPPFRNEVADYVTGLTVAAAVHSEAFTHPDGTRQLLVASTTGPLRILPFPATPKLGVPAPFFDLREYLAKRHDLDPKQTAFRLFSTLLESDLATRPHLYLFYNNRKPAPATNHVVRFEITSFAPFTLGGETEIISWESGGHNGGDLAWGPDGMLYITAGDRSAPGDPNNWGQRTDDIFGSILRIDVRSVDKGYAVPPDNPFVGIENVRPEIWSYGLRNPWRFTFHPESGELWVGDNGDENWELVHHIEKGANAGWSAFEGNAIFRASNPLSGPTLTHTPAVVQQPHSEMRSVIGGLFYRGDALPKLRDHYLYACYFTRRLWAFSYREGQIGTPFQIADSVGQAVAITEDHDREPIITCHSGEILRLIENPAPPTSKPWPAKLSATGLFSNTAKLQPATGVYPYQTNAPAWSDGATKKAFVAIASGKPMNAPGGVQLGKGFDVPEGSIVGQTLSIDGKPVETQLLHFDSNWRPFTYRWNEAGTDAELVPEGGLDTEIDGRPRRFMSRAECMSCHTHRSNFTLAFTVAQLDHPAGDGPNQIDAFISNKLLVNNAPLKQQRGKPTPNPDDGALPLNLRARSYLDLNCAHCHRETGLGGRAGFQLLAGLPLEETGILDAKPLVGLTGNPEARVLARGRPELSELLTRMSRRGPGQMPLLGTHAVDEKGGALIREWIRSLPPSEETAN